MFHSFRIVQALFFSSVFLASVVTFAQGTITQQKLKGQRGRFSSPELDYLFGVKDGQFSYENLKNAELNNHNVRLAVHHDHAQNRKRQLFLLLDNQNRLLDTVQYSEKECVAFFARLEGNREAVCVGEFNFSEQQFYIERVYELSSDQQQLIGVPEQTRIVYCPYAYDGYRSAKELSALQQGFTFSTLSERRMQYPGGAVLNGTEGLWRITCGNTLTTLDISETGLCHVSIDARTYINGEVIADETDSTVFWIAFRGFFFPNPDNLDAYEDSLSQLLPSIDRVQAIAKINRLSENSLWLEWYGLFDTAISEYHFPLTDLVFYRENARQRPIVVKRCY